MNTLHIFLLFLFISNTPYTHAMEIEFTDASTSCVPNFFAYNILPRELITKLVALCEMQSRAYLSLTNTYCQHYASLKTNPSLINALGHKHFADHRLYYLFYGCIHDIPDVVKTALTCFDPNKKEYGHCDTIYPEKELLECARECIKRFPATNATKLLPNYSYLMVHEQGPLPLAIGYCDNMLFRLLLKQPNINVNARCGLSTSVLHCIIYQANNHKKSSPEEALFLDMLDLLLKHPDLNFATINIPNLLGYNKCIFSLKIARHFFTQDSFDINQKNSDKNTILHVAIKSKNHPILQMLLTHSDIDLDIQNSYKNTLLHRAIDVCYIEGIKILLADPRCDIHKKNKHGQTPLEYAIKFKEELNKHGENVNIEKRNEISAIIDLLQKATQKSTTNT